ncbi:hypothetical protein [Haloechinothrix sp. LS1_15]|uniref:hypothetical protein n=1 Tax=Haloechinothrix sp. LS1_15 TaxID=2652248 RepID=UPI002946AFC8|nr:hypothetical protein [Haloechinothrix sp. LS1_15]MDV6014755.1 hypothetical protein [Haloechinothrix sp. LS1_15]
MTVAWVAHKSGVHVIQVRPITAPTDASRTSTEPVATAYDLYVDEPPAHIHIRDVAAIYGGYVGKRGIYSTKSLPRDAVATHPELAEAAE